jgi:trigger factor
MQVTETNVDGLKREFKVVIASTDIEEKVKHRLNEIGRTVRLPGFRPGKVPMNVLRQRYGSAVMGEVLERAVTDSSSQAMSERGMRPAMQPKIEIVSFNEGTDLEYKMAVELLPDIKPVDFSEIELERVRPEIDEKEVDAALERIAKSRRKSEPVQRAAQNGDAVTIDFVGRIDGAEFPGGAAQGYVLELGSGAFIPGFEEQLVGAQAGDKREVKVSFPADYNSAELAGKDAVFDVDVKEVGEFKTAVIDDELAKEIGMDSLEELRKAVREQIERDYGAVARQKLKRAVLDELAAKHDFAVPPGMLDAEFEVIWKQFQDERERTKDEPDDEDAGKSEDELKAEYRTIAERRVRLGLLLAEVGRANNITVSQEEVNRALFEEARRHPGYEKQLIEFYRGRPEALANLRAPIFEDKVIDFIVEMAKVNERTVPAKELLEGSGEDAAAGSDTAEDEPAKKSRASKSND